MKIINEPPGVSSIYVEQAPLILDQETPTENVWYTLFDEINCRIYQAALGIEDTDETLKAQITVDGIAYSGISTPVPHSTPYYIYRKVHPINGAIYTYIGTAVTGKAFIVEGKSVKVEICKTTIAGVGNLVGACSWGQIKG